MKKSIFSQSMTIKSMKRVTKINDKATKPNITPSSKMNIVHNIEEKHEG